MTTAATWASAVLDSQAMSLWMDDDRPTVALLQRLFLSRTPLIVCANTLIELATHPRPRRLEWLLSKVRVEPVTERVAEHAAALLRAAHLSGHTHAIDASVVAVALRHSPAVILSSDPEDMYLISGGQVHIIPV